MKQKNKTTKAFSLIEILISMTIMLTIFSLVYGTYHACASSLSSGQQNLQSHRLARSLLQKITRQINCLYLPEDKNQHTNTPHQLAPDKKNIDHILLHFISTAAIFNDPLTPNGPFEVAYKYDPATSQLSYCQKHFLPGKTPATQPDNWFPLANLKSIQLQYLTGQKWLDQWQPQNPLHLPNAIKITLTLHDQTTLTAATDIPRGK